MSKIQRQVWKHHMKCIIFTLTFKKRLKNKKGKCGSTHPNPNKTRFHSVPSWLSCVPHRRSHHSLRVEPSRLWLYPWFRSFNNLLPSIWWGGEAYDSGQGRKISATVFAGHVFRMLPVRPTPPKKEARLRNPSSVCRFYSSYSNEQRLSLWS